MDDVMHVTREMMAYLRGDRETLEVYTTVEGKNRISSMNRIDFIWQR